VAPAWSLGARGIAPPHARLLGDVAVVKKKKGEGVVVKT